MENKEIIKELRKRNIDSYKEILNELEEFKNKITESFNDNLRKINKTLEDRKEE